MNPTTPHLPDWDTLPEVVADVAPTRPPPVSGPPVFYVKHAEVSREGNDAGILVECPGGSRMILYFPGTVAMRVAQGIEKAFHAANLHHG